MTVLRRPSPRRVFLRSLLQVSLAAAPLMAAMPAAPALAQTAHKPHPSAEAKAAKKSTKKPAKKPAALPEYGERADVMAFADAQAESLGYRREELRALLALARPQPAVQRLILPGPPGQAKDWGSYRLRFVEPQRLQAGLAFWAANEAALARAEATYGVPAEIIASVIGVETFYGRIMGSFRVLDALATLSFDYPSPLPPGARDRSPFFREELRQFLILARENGLDPMAMKGSYAGAMGWGQFMPGSWRRYAIDFDGDGHVDLINSPVDAIGSVANFLREHGWQRGMPTHYEVQVPSDTAARAAADQRRAAATGREAVRVGRRAALAAGPRAQRAAGADRAADGRRRAGVRGGHAELLHGDPLQPEQLLRDGGHRVRQYAGELAQGDGDDASTGRQRLSRELKRGIGAGIGAGAERQGPSPLAGVNEVRRGQRPGIGGLFRGRSSSRSRCSWWARSMSPSPSGPFWPVSPTR